MAIEAAPWQLAVAIPAIGAVSALAWGGTVLVLRKTLGVPLTVFSAAQAGAAFGWLEQAFIGLIAAMLTFGWVAGNATDRAWLVETAWLQGVRAAASGLPPAAAGRLEQAVRTYATDVTRSEDGGKPSGAADASLDLLVAICRDAVDNGIGSPQARATLEKFAALLPSVRQERLSAAARHDLPFPLLLLVVPLGLSLLMGAAIRTASDGSDAVLNGLHAGGIAMAAAAALVLVLPATTISALPASFVGLAAP